MAFKSRICRARLSPKEGEATLRLVRPNLRAEVSFSLPKLVVFELPFCCYSSPHFLKQVSKRKRKNCEQSWVIFYLLTTQLSSFANYACLCVILVLILVFRRVQYGEAKMIPPIFLEYFVKYLSIKGLIMFKLHMGVCEGGCVWPLPPICHALIH